MIQNEEIHQKIGVACIDERRERVTSDWFQRTLINPSVRKVEEDLK